MATGGQQDGRSSLVDKTSVRLFSDAKLTATSQVNDVMTLIVDGKRFSVSPSLFTRHPNTMLGRYWSFS